jgi:SAM-dependent methyltransferase
MSITGDARVLFSMLRGQPRQGSHAERLAAFYGPQASQYDAFRERLLHGRAEMIDALLDALVDARGSLEGAHVVELGGGTGRNLLFFGERLDTLGRVDLVDLCGPLLDEARARTIGSGAGDRGRRLHLAPGGARGCRVYVVLADDDPGLAGGVAQRGGDAEARRRARRR